VSDSAAINESVIQRSAATAAGPATFIACAVDLHLVILDNYMSKYADDVSFILSCGTTSACEFK